MELQDMKLFFKKKDSKLKKIYNKNYILFLGTSLKSLTKK